MEKSGKQSLDCTHESHNERPPPSSARLPPINLQNRKIGHLSEPIASSKSPLEHNIAERY